MSSVRLGGVHLVTIFSHRRHFTKSKTTLYNTTNSTMRKYWLSSFRLNGHSTGFQDSKARTTLYSIINTTTVKYCSAAFIWMVTLYRISSTDSKVRTTCSRSHVWPTFYNRITVKKALPQERHCSVTSISFTRRSKFGQFEQPSCVRCNNVQQTVPKESTAHHAQSQFYRI